MRLVPGDPAALIAGDGATAEQIAQTRHELGLDHSELHQFVTYAQNIFKGDLGTSYVTKEPVSQMIRQRFGVSLQLAGAALAVVLVLGIAGGLLFGAFTREGRHPRAEIFFTGSTSLAGAVPDFLAATFLAYIFAVLLRWLPSPGREE